MKKATKPMTKTQLQKTHPLAELVVGWFFRCEEISAGRYEVEGIDLCGRTVSATGINPDDLLKKCVEDTKAIALDRK